jgi:hypothetical protein
MKQDIRNLFQEDEDLKQLPKNHRIEFHAKLKGQKRSHNKTKGMLWLQIAAVVVIALTIGFNVFNDSKAKDEYMPMAAQIEAVEKQYLKDIEKEWESFVALTDDQALVARYKKRLDDLDKDYQDITTQFSNDSYDIAVIESLVENLQTRLELLKDIQIHIKILNQNNEKHENTI